MKDNAIFIVVVFPVSEGPQATTIGQFVSVL